MAKNVNVKREVFFPSGGMDFLNPSSLGVPVCPPGHYLKGVHMTARFVDDNTVEMDLNYVCEPYEGRKGGIIAREASIPIEKKPEGKGEEELEAEEIEED